MATLNQVVLSHRNKYCMSLLWYYIVYNKGGYIEIVENLAQRSMKHAVDEVRHLPEYATKGEVCIALFMTNNEVHNITIVGHH